MCPLLWAVDISLWFQKSLHAPYRVWRHSEYVYWLPIWMSVNSLKCVRKKLTGHVTRSEFFLLFGGLAKALEHISSLLIAHNRLNVWPRSAKTLKCVGNLLTEHGGHSRCATVDTSQCQQVPHVRKCLMKKGRLSEYVCQCEGQQHSQMRQYSLYGKWRTLLMCLLV